MADAPHKPKRPRDTNQLAKRIVDVATGDVDETETPHEARVKEAKRRAARQRAESLTDEERSDIARKAAETRWASGT